MRIGEPLERRPAGHCQIQIPRRLSKVSSYAEASQVSRPALLIRVRRAFEGSQLGIYMFIDCVIT